MTTSLTRRGLVKAAPAALVATAVPALAGGADPDAVLLALRESYERTLAALNKVSPAHTRAEEAAAAAQLAQPHRSLADIEKEVGLDIAEARWNAAVDANGDVIEQITETPARTFEGLVFKARVAEVDSYNVDLAASIIDDLVAMGAAHA